jgi:5-methylcytosine-specific restriction endonuclease McrA
MILGHLYQKMKDINTAEVDHIKARSKGGTNSNSNLRVISKEENLKKGNR